MQDLLGLQLLDPGVLGLEDLLDEHVADRFAQGGF